MVVLGFTSMGSTFTSVRSLRYVIYPVQVRTSTSTSMATWYKNSILCTTLSLSCCLPYVASTWCRSHFNLKYNFNLKFDLHL
jgi:hypothetical protein